MCRIYTLLEILWWSLLAQWMRFVYTRGWDAWWTYKLLPRFYKGAPEWFTCGWAWASLWDDNLVDCNPGTGKCRPNTAFYLHYRRVARDRFQDWIDDAADTVARPLVNAVSALLGTLYHGYTTFSTWINAIRGRVGSWVPWWADHLAHAAVRLFDWLPSDITAGLVSFYDKFVAWYEATKLWVQVHYDAAKNWVANVAPDLTAGYITVRNWYDVVATWVTNFKADPYGTVASWLGAAWTTWIVLRYAIVDFYNNVWVPYKITLHDFLADPLGWTYDRVEDELIRRW